MAMAANMRPFIALGLSPDKRHAMIVLDVQRPLSEIDERWEEGPDFWQQSPGDSGLWLPETGDSVPLPWWQLDRRWLGLEVTLAAQRKGGESRPFNHACKQTLPWAPEVEWTLVDIYTAMLGQEAYQPQSGRAAYPIHTYFPELPRYREYRSREDLSKKLHSALSQPAPRTIVLQGPGGRGKSLLAQRLAWSADNGCGWLLTATDVPTLKASLAAAEQAERGEVEETGARAERANNVEVDQLAIAALRRLDSADVPWVVVVDNCDLKPDAKDLEAFIPRPRKAGQVVILTTRDEGWEAASKARGWQYERLPTLAKEDLSQIGLPDGLTALAGDPLAAETLAVLAADGCEVAARAGENPYAVVWALLLESLGEDAAAVRLARLLAWCPPLPLDVAGAPVPVPADDISAAARELVRLRFVAPSASAVDDLDDSQRHPEVRKFTRVQLHRLFGEAIRNQMWSLGNQQVMGVLRSLLTSEWGYASFIDATEQTALKRLEKHDLQRAAQDSSDRRGVGLVWHGLGHIRERRGPVADSGELFVTALKYLDESRDPYEVAEAQIGLARIVFQARAPRAEEMQAAQQRILSARRLLAPLELTEARQLAEQGNALYWLLQQKLVDREQDPARRRQLLEEVQEQLWRSFEMRLKLVRSAGVPVGREAPKRKDGLGAERAYYNLAGVALQLAKASFECGPDAASGETRPQWLDGIRSSLDETASVYTTVADLRAARYRDMPHPHHASCVHGLAIVAYHRAALLKEPEWIVQASHLVAQGLDERWHVALASATPDGSEAVSNGDVGKSFDLLSKIAVEAQMAAPGTLAERKGRALKASDDGITELVGWETQDCRSDV